MAQGIAQKAAEHILLMQGSIQIKKTTLRVLLFKTTPLNDRMITNSLTALRRQ
jgi:hypothetical protein